MPCGKKIRFIFRRLSTRITSFPLHGGIASHSSRITISSGLTCESAYEAPPTISVSTTFAEYGLTASMTDKPQLLERAQKYADANGTRIVRIVEFGHGMDGSVWVSDRDSAIKAIRNQKNFADELESYRRLKLSATRELCGFAVPWLIGFDDHLQVVEMSIVQKPYLLDFGKVYFDGDEHRAFDERELANDRAAARTRYTSAEWSRVAILLHTLEAKYGIYYVDARPVNIDCGQSTKDDPDWDKEPDLDYSQYEDEAGEE